MSSRHFRSSVNGSGSTGMVTSVRLSQHEHKRQDKEFVTEIVADVQDPAAPIFRAACHGQRPYNARCVVTRFCQALYSSTTSINQGALGVGAMEIDLSHVTPPAKWHAAKVANKPFPAVRCERLTSIGNVPLRSARADHRPNRSPLWI